MPEGGDSMEKEKAKTNTQWAFVVFLIFDLAIATFFLILGIQGRMPRSLPNSWFYFAGFLADYADALCFLLFAIALGIAVMGFAFREKKPALLFLELLIVPFVCVFLFEGLFGEMRGGYERKIEAFDSTLVLANENYDSGSASYSNIYQKMDAFSIRYVATIEGKRGQAPLSDPAGYSVNVYQNGIVLAYPGIGEDGNSYSYLYLVKESNGLWRESWDIAYLGDPVK
jgi:hypothetical protein